MHEAFPDRFYVSENLRVVEAEARRLLRRSTASRRPRGRRAVQKPADPVVKTVEEVRSRALDALADEIRLMLDEGVVPVLERWLTKKFHCCSTASNARRSCCATTRT
jgi:hypothetical protein